MAEKAKEEVKNIDLDMDKLTLRGKIHAEQYNAEIEKIDVLMSYYTKTIQDEAKKWAEENPETPEDKEDK